MLINRAAFLIKCRLHWIYIVYRFLMKLKLIIIKNIRIKKFLQLLNSAIILFAFFWSELFDELISLFIWCLFWFSHSMTFCGDLLLKHWWCLFGCGVIVLTLISLARSFSWLSCHILFRPKSCLLRRKIGILHNMTLNITRYFVLSSSVNCIVKL